MRVQLGLLALVLATPGCSGCEIHANTIDGPPRAEPKAAPSPASEELPEEAIDVEEIVVEPGMEAVVRERVKVTAAVAPEALAFNYQCGAEGEQHYVSQQPDIRLALPAVMPRLQVGIPQKVWGLLVSNGERFWCKKAKTEHGVLLNLADLPAATYDVRIVLASQGMGEYRLELRDPTAAR